MPPIGHNTPTRVLVITGPPAVGKTTLVKTTVEAFQQNAPQVEISGFYTEELRDAAGDRIGFDVVAVGGAQRAALARVEAHSQAAAGAPQLGKYIVDVGSFESVALPILEAASARRRTEAVSGQPPAPSHLLVIDEIARMELFSDRFATAFEHNLQVASATGQVSLLAVAQKGKGLIATVKARPDCSTFTLSKDNRGMGTTAVEDKLRSLFGIMRDSWDLIPAGGWSGALGPKAVPGSGGSSGGGGAMTASQKKNAKKKAKAKAAQSAAQLADGSAPALEPEPAPASSPSASTPLDPAKEIKKLNKKLRQIDDLKVRLPQSPHESCKLAFTHACSACQRRKRWPQE